MRPRARKTTPRVSNGRVQRKNHRDARVRPCGELRVRTEVPRIGYRHHLTEDHVRAFVELVPEWTDVSEGLHEIVLAEHEERCDGWYRSGSIGLCAWVDAQEVEVSAWWATEHRELLRDLGVRLSEGAGTFIDVIDASEVDAMLDVLDVDDAEVVRGEDRWTAVARTPAGDRVEVGDAHPIEGVLHVYERTYDCRFTPAQVRAYQLLHVLLHELGHHRDAMTLPHRGTTVRGEAFAEHWAYRTAARVWSRYFSR